MLPARVEVRRDRARDDPAVDAEARVGRQEDLDRVVLVELVPLVDDVVRAAADQRGDGDDDDPVAEDVGVLAGTLREPDQQEVGRSQAERHSRSPYQPIVSGPMVNAVAFGDEVEHRAGV